VEPGQGGSQIHTLHADGNEREREGSGYKGVASANHKLGGGGQSVPGGKKIKNLLQPVAQLNGIRPKKSDGCLGGITVGLWEKKQESRKQCRVRPCKKGSHQGGQVATCSQTTGVRGGNKGGPI